MAPMEEEGEANELEVVEDVSQNSNENRVSDAGEADVLAIPADASDETEESMDDDFDMNIRISAPNEASGSGDVVEEATSESPEAAISEFTVEFHSLDSSISNLVVTCQVGAGNGPTPVRIVCARTPCVVRGSIDDGTSARRISVPLDSSAIYYCYEGGSPTCRKEAL